MTVADAGQFWLSRRVEREDSGLSVRTREQYRGNFNRYLSGSKIEGLTLLEVNRVHVIEDWMQAIADERGSGAAKSARSVLSGILGEAVRLRALPFNAVRECRTARGATKVRQRDTSRAATRVEREHFLEILRSDERARTLDLVDFGHFMAGTGCRIGEALRQRWSDVDLLAGTVRIRGTKTDKSDRVIHLPGWLLGRLQDRSRTHGDDELLFASPRLTDGSKPRDQRNVQRELRRVLDKAGMPWATPHTLRRTVASDIDAAGLPIALAADVLGHADPSMTARVYLGRKGSTAAAADVL